MAEVATAVIVVGSLGETYKKLIETELRVIKDPKNTAAIIEVESLMKLIEQWPVIDEHKAYMFSQGMRSSIIRFKSEEEALENLIKEIDRDGSLKTLYFSLYSVVKAVLKYRDEIRTQIAALNKLSGGVGKASALPPNADLLITKIGDPQ